MYKRSNFEKVLLTILTVLALSFFFIPIFWYITILQKAYNFGFIW